ncbi:MAG: DNA/RNA non-specific endonuclease [Muribaculaceae bacterium]|nr:DNA/RNA non-specific endonuclease [Muribaculaceae bacterium]
MSKKYNDKMSVVRTLCLTGVTIVLACCVVKACNALMPKIAPETPAIITETDGLLEVKTAPGVTEQIKEYTGFTVSFNADTHLPNWVSWELTADKTSGPAERKGKRFFKDYDIKGCPAHRDYTGSGYTRGHMAPAGDMKWSEEAMTDCFTMANMCPQLQALNSGTWGKVEDKCRQWALRDSALIIIAGPVINPPAPDEFIGDIEVAVPKQFFKVVLAPYANPPRAIGFLMPQGKVYGGMQATVVTVDSIESLTGHDFFASLPDSIETLIESKAQFHKWNNAK